MIMIVWRWTPEKKAFACRSIWMWNIHVIKVKPFICLWFQDDVFMNSKQNNLHRCYFIPLSPVFHLKVTQFPYNWGILLSLVTFQEFGSLSFYVAGYWWVDSCCCSHKERDGWGKGEKGMEGWVTIFEPWKFVV